jgi:hypothetical protein
MNAPPAEKTKPNAGLTTKTVRPQIDADTGYPLPPPRLRRNPTMANVGKPETRNPKSEGMIRNQKEWSETRNPEPEQNGLPL